MISPFIFRVGPGRLAGRPSAVPAVPNNSMSKLLQPNTRVIFSHLAQVAALVVVPNFPVLLPHDETAILLEFPVRVPDPALAMHNAIDEFR